MTHHSFWYYWITLFGLTLSGYFVVAGGAYLLFYPPFGQVAGRRLRLKPPQAAAMAQDIRLAVLSTLFFATAAALVMQSYERGMTLLYSDLSQYSYWYAAVSFGAVLILQDTYFYFIHRAFHQPILFKHLHAGHHRSGDPTPWTSFAFDPAEAFLQAVFLAGVTFIIPINFIIFTALLITMTLWTVINHLGSELFPASFPQHWLGQWLIGSTHHSIHHRKYRVHYGLYFTVWDKLLGTDDLAYEQEFDASLLSARTAKDLDQSVNESTCNSNPGNTASPD